MTQLRKLATPIPDRFLTTSGKGMTAVDHTVVTQMLHLHVPGWSFELVEILRSDVPEFTDRKNKTYPGGYFITGCVFRLTVDLDGHRTVIEEAGGLENAAMTDGDGKRLKKAASDALKRAAMRIGLGLHVWAQASYFLDRALDKQAEQDTT